MIRTMALSIALILAPAVALAHNCPALMAEIDSALADTSLSGEELERVQELRAEGEELHVAGDHDGSMEALEEAKALLGI